MAWVLHPLLGFPREVVPPKVSMALKKHRIGSLKPWDGLHLEGVFRPEAIFPKEKPLAGRDVSLTLRARERQQLDVTIDVPKNAPRGAHYYLHIVQTTAGRVTGGYTVGIIVRPHGFPLEAASATVTPTSTRRRRTSSPSRASTL